MIWFWVPISLVIVNDVAAYVCGMLFGRHQLIKLSPKKTVEGFVGALIVTMIFAYFVRLLSSLHTLSRTNALATQKLEADELVDSGSGERSLCDSTT